jgi:hypothetical protein
MMMTESLDATERIGQTHVHVVVDQTIDPCKIFHIFGDDLEVQKQSEQTLERSCNVPVSSTGTQKCDQIWQHFLGKMHHSTIIRLGNHERVKQGERHLFDRFRVDFDIEKVGVLLYEELPCGRVQDFKDLFYGIWIKGDRRGRVRFAYGFYLVEYGCENHIILKKTYLIKSERVDHVHQIEEKRVLIIIILLVKRFVVFDIVFLDDTFFWKRSWYVLIMNVFVHEHETNMIFEVFFGDSFDGLFVEFFVADDRELKHLSHEIFEYDIFYA